MSKLVAHPIFSKIEVDERVTPNLMECLYCHVETFKSNSYESTNYKISLVTVNEIFKQCPSCKRLYMVGDIVPKDNY